MAEIQPQEFQLIPNTSSHFQYNPPWTTSKVLQPQMVTNNRNFLQEFIPKTTPTESHVCRAYRCPPDELGSELKRRGEIENITWWVAPVKRGVLMGEFQ